MGSDGLRSRRHLTNYASMKRGPSKHWFRHVEEEHTLSASIFRKLMNDFSYGKAAL